MSVNESGSAEQGGLVPATVKTAWASAGGVLDRAHATAGMPGKDLTGNRDSAGHMMMDGFIWHSISCVCNSCVRNDKTFRVTFNRQDFRPFMIAPAQTDKRPPPGGSAPGSVACSVQAAAGA